MLNYLKAHAHIIIVMTFLTSFITQGAWIAVVNTTAICTGVHLLVNYLPRRFAKLASKRLS